METHTHTQKDRERDRERDKSLGILKEMCSGNEARTTRKLHIQLGLSLVRKRKCTRTKTILQGKEGFTQDMAVAIPREPAARHGCSVAFSPHISSQV